MEALDTFMCPRLVLATKGQCCVLLTETVRTHNSLEVWEKTKVYRDTKPRPIIYVMCSCA